jgi:hypothetical protein
MNKEDHFKNILSEIEEILFNKVPVLNERYIKMQNLDFFDIEEFKNINTELDLSRGKYKKLRNSLYEINKEIGIEKLKELIKIMNNSKKAVLIKKDAHLSTVKIEDDGSMTKVITQINMDGPKPFHDNLYSDFYI